MTTTEKDPKKESAMKAPTMGRRLLVPKMMLVICVALMLFTLNFVIRNTIKLDPHPPPAIDRPNILPDSVHHFISNSLTHSKHIIMKNVLLSDCLTK